MDRRRALDERDGTRANRVRQTRAAPREFPAREDGGELRASGLRPYTALSAVLEIFTAEFDGAGAERGLFLLTMHPHITGHRSRIGVLEALIEHMKRVGGSVWFATHEDAARYCKENAS